MITYFAFLPSSGLIAYPEVGPRWGDEAKVTSDAHVVGPVVCLNMSGRLQDRKGGQSYRHVPYPVGHRVNFVESLNRDRASIQIICTNSAVEGKMIQLSEFRF